MECQKNERRCHCHCRESRNNFEMCYHPKLFEMLRYISILFKEQNVPFWLDRGALLGAVRNNKIIPWDNDIDLGVWYSDYEKILQLAPRVLEDGYKLEPSGALTQIVFRYSPVCIWTICIDGWDVKDGEAYIIQYPRHHCPEANLQNLDKIMFEGMEYPCPQHPEVILANFYRKNWKIPQVLSLCKSIVKYFRQSNKDVLKEMEKYNYYD